MDNSAYYFPRGRHSSGYGYNQFFDSRENRRMRAVAAALVEQERRRRQLMDIQEKAFRERQNRLKLSQMPRTVRGSDGRLYDIYPHAMNRAAHDGYVGFKEEEQEDEEEDIMDDSSPILSDMRRPYTSRTSSMRPNHHTNMFQRPVDGNAGWGDEYPHEKPKTKTGPALHGVPPASAYKFVPDPGFGGFGDLKGTVFSSSNHDPRDGKANPTETTDTKSRKSRPTNIFQLKKGPDGRLHFTRIGDEEIEETEQKQTSADIKPKKEERFLHPEDTHPYRIVIDKDGHVRRIRLDDPLHRELHMDKNPQDASTVKRDNRTPNHVPPKFSATKKPQIDRNVIHPEDTHRYRVELDPEGHVHRVILDEPTCNAKERSQSQDESTVKRDNRKTQDRTPLKPDAAAKKPQNHHNVIYPEDTHRYRVELDPEGHVHRVILDEPACNAANESLYHQKLMEKELRKHDYMNQQRKKREAKSVQRSSENDAMEEPHEVFVKDKEVHYDIASKLVPEYHDDSPSPYEMVKGPDGKLHPKGDVLKSEYNQMGGPNVTTQPKSSEVDHSPETIGEKDETKPQQHNSVGHENAHTDEPEYHDHKSTHFEMFKPEENKQKKLPSEYTPTGNKSLHENYIYTRDEHGIIHRTLAKDVGRQTTLVTGPEDASDSEHDVKFDDTEHNLRPEDDDEWLEPHGVDNIERSERLRANNIPAE
ncbi:predicted protein [Chaetoceros tenuissimus]|uniref:Uncharacterized protein n=1 Tax=Chaetoceros tenuissimus TaxID=426638 RepID=A0AAD3H421_9STRA|nr:predicted protein [Chaetoceros tenuissimus]